MPHSVVVTYQPGDITPGDVVLHRGIMKRVEAVNNDTLFFDDDEELTLSPGDAYEVPQAPDQGSPVDV